jgi:hypothetical protein
MIVSPQEAWNFLEEDYSPAFQRRCLLLQAEAGEGSRKLMEKMKSAGAAPQILQSFRPDFLDIESWGFATSSVWP